MTVPSQTAPLSREEKQALLRARLVQRISQARTEPASFAQERLWFLERMNGASALYNVPEALRLRGALDVAALERALGGIVRRHESLRTTFREVDGAPVQVIAPFAGFALPVDDLSALPADAREAQVGRRAADDAALPFDLEQGPLFRAALLRLGDDDHVLLLCMHHVVTDGWSTGVLFRELSALYAAYAAGQESAPAPLPLQYADYAAEQRGRLTGEAMDRELAWWTERLAGAPALLELPTDRPRPALRSHRGARERVELPAALVERLHAVARAEGASMYMLTMGAFQLLLGRYAASDDVVVGTAVAGRTRPEVEGLIGFFVNTLVMRTDLSGDPSFREVVRRARATTLGAFGHQEMPFERLVAELQPDRGLGHSPLFQVMFSLGDEDRATDGLLPGVRASRVHVETPLAKFDLALSMSSVDGGGMAAELVYATDVFDAGTVRRMLGHLRGLLEQAAADADAPVSRLELLLPAERAQVLDAWNATDAAYPADRCIHHLFEAQAARTPGGTAVSHDGERVTYAELNARANRLAHHLRRRGVGPEVRAALCMERGVEMVVAMLAILKAGGAWVPLDPAHPAERLERMLADSGAAVLLTQDRLRAALPSTAGIDVLCVDAEGAAIAAESAENPEGGATPGGLAYVIYTSGSTGTPKGVGIEHRALVNHMAWFIRDFGVTAADRVLQKTPVVFDASVWEFHAPLLVGGELVMARHEGERDARYLARTLRDRGITVLQLVPSLLRVLLDEPALAECTALRHLFCGGEPLPGELARRAAQLLPAVRITNLYGPAECCIDTSTHVCGDADGERAVVPIGRPVSNTRSYVLDAALRPVPVGVPGELCIGGVQVGRGYLGRAALTAERFVPDPFGAEPGARLYRTGDRVRWSASGALEFLGRTDFQVKIRGVRIELGEIEAALRDHDAVRDAIVRARADAPGEKRLVAYVVGDADVDALRAHLAARLPAYMVPAAYVRLDALPLTPNGKVDRKALPEPELASDAERYAAPRTPTEEVLAGLFAELLRAERVGRDDDFFALGGHSLLATRLASRVRVVFGVELPLRDLFAGATPAQLAERVEALRRAGLPSLPPVVPVERTDALPLSFAQERLWFLDRMEPDSPLYNVPSAVRLSGALDAPALERALGEIVRRHEALRTVFAEAGGAPVQVIAPFAGFTLPVEDLSALDAASREAEITRRADEDAARPFDLAAGPLFRASLLRVAADEHVLLLCIHHVVSDAWSMGVFYRELSALYDAFRQGGESPLPELALQYADYAVWQRAQLRGEVMDRELAWWKERLSGAPALLELPLDRPRPAARSHHGADERMELPAALVERLQAVARAEGATLYMVLMGAFQVLLARYAASEDVVVGSPIAGRTQPEVEGLIGFFVNTLVMRTDLSGDPAFREVVRRVREVTLGAFEHQDVPFERLVAELQPDRSLSHSPLFQVMFMLGGGAGQPEGLLPGLRVSPVAAEMMAAKFDLTLWMSPQDGGGMAAELVYATDVFDGGTIRRMLGHLSRVLEQVAADADARLSRLELLDGAERTQVLDAWNGTSAPVPAASIHALFAEQAARTPDAVAVTFQDESVTYAELDARSNRLANHLVAMGVGPESRVGLCLERGPELVAAVLAILKAGGAYVPLDPSYPAERLAFMQADSGIAVLLTQESLRASLPASNGVTVVSIDGDAREIADREPAIPYSLFPIPSNGLAYVIYTSGSTGTPKGVGVEHRNVVRLVRGADYASLGADEVMLQAAPVSFDASTLELWGALLNGGRLVVMPGTNFSLEELGRAIVRHGVTTVWLTAGLFQVMVQERLEDLHGVRQLLAGGDVLPVDAVTRVRARFPEMRLINGYGPTENTTFTCCHTVDGTWSGGPVPIGTPIRNTRVYVLDANLRPVPVGVTGELYAGGEGVARGYLGRAALTAERFVPDPFSSAPGARMYRTGDRVRWTASGVVEYLGRLDAQVKVRGFRIELGEIEAVLRRHPAVADCTVIARGGDAGDKRVIAYVVGTAAEAELRAHLKARLPDHMVPAAIVSMDALPLTPNGKVDRKALPEPDLASDAERYAAPRTPAEEVLAGLFAELLRVERVGRDDDFFALGGHSLLATRLASRVRAVFGVELPLRDLFAGGTPARLAERVEALRRAGLPALPPVVPVERTDALPLSFAQERLWFLDRMEPGSPLYNVPHAARLTGALDAAALERALGEIVRRHEALRTVFREGDGGPVQVIAPFTGFTLSIEDLSALDAASREAEVARLADEDAARPFDLAAGPLFRATLLRVAADEHVLLLCMHHVVSDAWSMGVFYRELSALYGAYRRGGESPLPELALQYADYAVWQRAHLQGEVMDRELAWWKERLSGAPAVLELPLDRPRHAAPTYHGAGERMELPAVLVERLQALARAEGATLYMVLMGAFQVLLGRYAASEDVVVGSPVAGRTQPEVEGLIGFFVNTLVMRTDLSGDPAFREVLGRVREATLGAFEHQDVPFERLVAELQPDRSLTHSPLFQVMFSLVGADRGPEGLLPGLRVSPVEAEMPVAKFDLMLAMSHENGGGMAAELVYATDVFDGGTIRRMLGHLRRVLEQVAADADARLSRLELLDGAERTQLLDEWNRTSAPVPAASIQALFAEQAARTPDAVAVTFQDESVTYAELDARANRLANHLVAMGVGPESRVGMCLERGPDLVVAVLGILKAGGAYVPLDPSYPAERLAFMQADSGIAVLLTQESLRASLPAADGVTVVSIDGDAREIADREPAIPYSLFPIPSNGLAYVIYTSGSTGTPKGVAVEHRNVVRLVRGADYASLGADEVMLQAAPVSFDASTLELWGALLNGGRLVVMPGTNPSLEELGRAIVRHGVTTLWLTAGLFQVMVQERLEDLGGVRQLLAGGDVLPVDAVAKVRARFPEMRLINGYGPTENTTFTCCHTVDGTWSGGPVPIGNPISNTRVYVLDSALSPVPVGVAGELYAGGEGVARGYLGRAALTAERFVPDPFASKPGARMYRTGDRVRWTASGVVEYLGRLDEQVKIRGFRIELGEIEAVLRRHPGVADCTVVARGGDAGDKRVIAYVVGDAAEGELRAHLKASLPDHMVPAAIVSMDALPLTPNGKVDRKALPEPELASDAERYAAPRTPTEEVLAGLFAELLRVERVGRDDDFFALGGHSLLATRVASRVRAVFGVELPLRDLFAGGTPAQLAERVEALRRAGLPALPPVVAVDRDHPLPLSFAQERLWFLDRMEPDSPLYNVPSAARLSGALDAAALERALGEIVRRHEALRTVFREGYGGPVQVIAPFAGFTLPVEDLSALDSAERDAQVARRAAEDVARPFDLAAGPLFRASLLRVAADEHVLLLCMHHVASDAWSMGVLYRELSALYGAYRRGGESPLPELALQYADYAVWQRQQLSGEVLDAQLAWWKERLAGAPALLELPLDRPRRAEPTYHGADERMELPAALVERLQAVARAEGATLYMVLMGAFQVLLGRYAGSDDVVVGSPIAGRTRAEVEGLIGFFVNTLVMRTDLSGDPAFCEVLGRVREATLGAFEHQDVPFERLVAELQPERSLTHSPLFQVMFSLVGGDGETKALLPGLRVSPVAAEIPVAKFDLMLAMSHENGGGMAADLVYATDVFDGGTVRRMLGHLRSVLEQVADDADARVSRLELLRPDERALVLEEWNRTEAAYPADATLHTLFEAQAARTPHALAATHGTESVTYAELNARANRLARHLVRLGVQPEARVGIGLARGVEMLVSMLAVLKAGGAYVPLDPAYPAERLEFTLRDARVGVLLTQESLRGVLPVPAGVRVVSVDAAESAGEIARESAENLGIPVSPRTLGYLIYTSGSTGVPKGVAIEHESAVVLLAWAAELHTAEELGGMLACTSICFDLSVYELFLPLSLGGRVIIVENALALPSAPAADQVRLLNTVPSAAAALLKVGGIPAGVTTVNLAGEPLRTELVDALYAHGVERVIDLYGPSEDTTYSTYTLRKAGARATIGRPIANTRAYVLDARMQPVPAGVPGELYLAGRGLARGYLGRPSLTAERFIPDPFGAEAGGRMYRTGDRVRWTAEGTLEYLGRTDFQVKVRGFRIELGEIATTLCRHPAVRDCVVVVREHAPGEMRLVAYVAGDADVDALRTYLRRSVPEYMVPSAWVLMDALPLTPNGKVDRKALPEPELASDTERYAAPRTPTEEVLAGVFAELLRVERVGRDDDFFALGGHSLLATRVASRIRAVFGVELPLRELFAGATPARSAERVEALRRAGLPALPPVAPVERTDALPLSFAQERLWFLDRMEPDSPLYNVPSAVRLSGALDAAALERALGEIVRRHEALRTAFREGDAGPVQVIVPFAGFTLSIEDLSALDSAEREARVARRAAEDAARPFDLTTGPLFRATLLRIAENEHVLLLCIHHIASDGWSMGVLYRELSALYDAYRRGGESPLPELAVQYADYAAWQRRQLQGEVMDRELAWWKERLAGAPALLELPLDRPRYAEPTYHGAGERMELPAALVERLQALARAEGATLYMVLMGAFQVLLGRYAGSDDIVVGSPIAGRTRAEVEGLIGFFVNTLVMRTDLSGDPAFREVVRRVRETTLGAFEHQDVPFEKLVAELQPDRSLTHSPLFQVMFMLAGGDGEMDGLLPGLRVSPVEAEIPVAKFDLTLSLAPQYGGGMSGALVYATDVFDSGTIRRMLGHLRSVLEQVADDADARVSRLELLRPDERAQVLEEWNRTEAAYPADATLHTLFQAQAARTPDALAATFGTESVTYAELNARANRLARHLVRLGVQPEARVGIGLARGVEMLVSMLAVLKAGGAYVPLDPAYPAERLAFTLRDARVGVLLTQESLRGVLPVPDGVRVVSVDAAASEIAAERAENLDLRVSPRGLGYLIYTSGSTGVPKGVAIEHESAVVLLAWAAELHTAEELGGMLACTSICFDLSVYELFLPLSRGGRVIIVDNALALPSAPAADQVRLLNTVPSAAAALLKAGGIPAGVTTVNLAGEPLRTELVDALYAHGVERVIDLYGPSEDTTYSTYTLRKAGARATIGRPIANTRAYVLDARMQPVPAGVPGELYLAGRGLARGYLGRPSLTAERFVPDPFGAVPGGRMYRTGDRVRWIECVSADVRECGSSSEHVDISRMDAQAHGPTDALTHSRTHALEYLGRFDHQVKVRGFRIELGEIDTTLRRHPAVRDCLVVVREDAPGDTRLVAYVVGGAEVESLRAHLRASLPDHMVPSAFVALDALPLTPNGKLDRKALPAPEYASAAAWLPPRDERERAVAEAWKEVLGVAEVGASDNFFDLGGSSLLLTRVFGRLREIRADLRMVDLFRYTTVEALAGYLGAEATSAASELADSRSRAEERRNSRRRARSG